jgi:DNA mismatch repair ATPase MutL
VPFKKRKEMFSQIRAKHALASHALSSWLAREEAHETAVAQQRVAQQRQHREEEKDQQQQQQSSSSLPPLQAKQHPQKDVSSPQKAKASFEDNKSRPESSSFSSSSSTAAKDDLSAVPPPAGPKREDWVKLVHGDEAASDVGMGGVGVFELPCAEIGPPVRLKAAYSLSRHSDKSMPRRQRREIAFEAFLWSTLKSFFVRLYRNRLSLLACYVCKSFF